MRKIYLLLIVMLGMSGVALCQTAASYSFTATTGTFTTISGSGTATTSISADDVTQTGVSIGFNFTYCGTTYNRLAVSSNGWICLANASTTGYYSYYNDVSSLLFFTSSAGLLMPFWDDLYGSGHTAYYRTSGTAPYRTFTFEWTNWGLFADYTHYANMQVILYETTNQIDFVYGTSSYPGRTASIGLVNSFTDHKMLDNSSSSPTPSTSTFATSISTLPANGQIYRWNPPAAACSGTPSAGFAGAAPVSACGSSTFTLSLTGYTVVSGVTYQWQQSADSSSWSDITGATTLTYTTSETSALYYRCKITCTSSSSTGYSSGVFVPYLAGCYCIPSYSRAYASCDSIGISVTGYRVNGVAGTSIVDLDHCTGTGYYNHTSLSVSLYQAASYTATINGSSTYNMNAQTWIDLNDDFIFQTTESVGGVNNYGATGTYSIAVPAGAATGTHRMRIVTINSAAGTSYPSLNPCAGYAWGEARDYLVNIYPVCSGTPAGGTAASSASPVCTAASFTLSVSGYTVAGSIGFQWQSSPDNSTWNNIGGATNFTYTTTETATTYYRCMVTCAASSTSTPSSSVMVTFLAACYCTPSYTAATMACTNGVVIGSLQIAGTASTVLNDVAACTGSGYQNRTALSVSFLQGGSYTAYIAAGLTSTNQNTQTWIDFNNDGTFAASESVGGVNNFTSAGVYTVAIPGGAATGSHRMRVVTSRSSDGFSYSSMNPCTTGYARGEARDYTVNILPNTCSGTPSAGSLSASATSACASFSPTITASGYTAGPGTSYRWETSTDSLSWSSVSGATSSSITPTVTGLVYYRFVDSCSTSASASRTAGMRFVVLAVPMVAPITGGTTVCQGLTLSLSETSTGGTWSSAIPTMATLSTSGVVTGLLAGTDTIRYSITNACGTATASHVITILTTPSAGTISGTATVCTGSSVTFTSSGTAGGTWTASNATATVSGGIVYGVSAGIDTITYTVTNTCGTQSANRVATVVAAPNAGIISGASAICVSDTTTLTTTGTGGTWSTTNGTASVSPTGLVRGVSTGTDTVVYTVTNSCGTSIASHVVTIGVAPSAGTISGTTTVCAGSSISLTATVTGGSWSATNSRATVSGGTVWGVSAGIDTIRYSVTGACGTGVSAHIVTVNLLPVSGTLSGTDSVCVAASVTITPSVSGGSWSVTNSHASVIGGSVTGVSAGVDTVVYTVSNSCGSATASRRITINPLPNAGTISGTSSVCEGATITLATSGGSGTWSTANTRATVSTAGVVTGNTAGIDTVVYTATNSCGTSVARYAVTVNPSPNAGTLSGLTTICVGSFTGLSASASGGAWSVTNSTATVTAGLVTGLSAGTDTVIYTITNMCGTANTSAVVTINPLPFTGSVSGAASGICEGATTTFTATGGTGSWSASPSSVATIDAGTGVVTGAGGGTATITYTVTNSCGTARTFGSISVTALPHIGSLSGPSTVCEGAYITFAAGTAGGSWYATNSNATVSGGTVGGIVAGVDTIIYVLTNSCGVDSMSRMIAVDPLPVPGTLSASTTTVCAGSSITYTPSVSGGTWSIGSSLVAGVSTSGSVTGVGGGITNVYYTVTNVCGSRSTSMPVTVIDLPTAGSITGSSLVCAGSTSSLSTTGMSGGTWRSSSATLASVDVYGTVFGYTSGSVTISYTVSNSCGSSTATHAVTVNPMPFAGTISGPAAVCSGANITLSRSGGTGAGNWYSLVPSIAGVGATTGIVTGGTPGTTTILYVVSGPCGDDTAYYTMTVNALPAAGSITGPTTVCEGATITLSNPTGTAGGVWTSTNAARATVSTAGIVTGVGAGTVTISYTAITTSCGTAATSSSLTVNPAPRAGIITGASQLCPGTTITLTDTASGGSWSSTNIHTTHAGGAVSGVTVGADTLSYTVTNSCGTAVARHAVAVLPIPTGGTISGPTSVCAGGGVITLANTEAGGTWSASSGIATVNPSTGDVTGLTAGTVRISYTFTNICGSGTTNRSVTVSPAVMPAVSATIAPGTSVCAGTIVNFTANPVNGGATPTYIWRNGSTYMGSSSTFSYIPVNGDRISVTMTSSAACLIASGATSPAYNMVVGSEATPTVTITASPNDSAAFIGQVINYTAVATNGGTAPTYAWYVNGALQAGATSSVFSQACYSNQTVYCELTSNAPCVTVATVASNLMKIYADYLTVSSTGTSQLGLHLYPNPNNGNFTVTGTVAGSEEVAYSIMDVTGKAVAKGVLTPANGVVNQTIEMGNNLAAGQYIIRCTTNGATQNIHFVKAD